MIKLHHEVEIDVELYEIVNEAQSKSLCVTIDEMMGNPEQGQDENERYGWEIMIGDVGKFQHESAVPALLDAIDYAESRKIPLLLSEEFIADLGGGWYGMLTEKQWRHCNLDDVTDDEWDEMNKDGGA